MTFGLWCALAIHDTSSVTGAAMTHGPLALATATTVKLARALWIVPVALALGAWFARRDGQTRHAGAKFPWFIGGFLALSTCLLASGRRLVCWVGSALPSLPASSILQRSLGHSLLEPSSHDARFPMVRPVDAVLVDTAGNGGSG